MLSCLVVEATKKPAVCCVACREDDTARLATARADAERRASAAEAEAVALRQQLEAAQQQLAAERARGEELVGLLYPLTARVKALEAAQAETAAG